MIIGSRQKLLAEGNPEPRIRIDNKSIEKVTHTKSLGLIIDNRLTWAKHISEISKKVSMAIGAMKRIRPCITTAAAVQTYNSLILPHFDYCSPVWDGLNNELSEKLQKIQNRAARVITKTSYDTRSRLLRKKLHWDTLAVRRKKQKVTLVFKTLNKKSPVYLQDLFTPYCTDYNLRNSEQKLALPIPRTNYLKRSFSYDGAILWNNLPQQVRIIDSLGQFKREINRIF